LKVLLFLITVFSFSSSFCQFIVNGRVIDRKTKEPLAFASIIFNNKNRLGTTTDIDGKFFFRSQEKIRILTCSYMGFKNQTLDIDTISKRTNLIIELSPAEITLQEVVILPGENPANRILRNVIENKKINDPENISSFKYKSYNKIIYDFKPNDSLVSKTTQTRMENKLNGGHLLIMESVTERKFIHPNTSEEIILGT
jgi:hypothetical protein